MENTVEVLILKIKSVTVQVQVRYSNAIQPPIIAARSPTALLLLIHVKRKSSRLSRTVSAHLLHGRELSFGHSQLVRVQAAGLGKNWWVRASEKMVANWMVRWRGGETIGGENFQKF